MQIIEWLAPAFAMAALGGSGQPQLPDQAEAPAPLEETDTTDEIELDSDRYRRYTIPVTINGTGPYNFMVDTGAQATVLARSLADRLELGDRRPVTLVGMASRRETETVAIDELTFGTRTMPVRGAPLVDGSNLGPIDGILGLDILQDQRVLLDFKRGLIAVDDADQLGGNAGYEIVVRARERRGQLIITTAKINGIRTSVLIDTGAQASIGNKALERRLRGRTLGFQWVEDVNGVVLVNPVRRAEKLEIGEVTLTNVPMAFNDAEPFRALDLMDQPAMILGLSELRQFERVAIDFPSRRIRFDLPRGTRLRDIYTRDPGVRR